MRKHDTERLQFEHFLNVTGSSFDSWIQEDKPDIVAVKAGIKIGIELTDGSSEAFHRARDIARKQGMTSFSTSSINLSSSEELQKNSNLAALISDPRFVKTELSTISWSRRIASKIHSKATLLNKGEIRKFERNWLVVLDTGTLIDDATAEFHRGALMASMGLRHLTSHGFDVTYIICSRALWIIDAFHVRIEVIPPVN